MSLSCTTIAKFMRENFSGGSPLEAVPEHRQTLVERLKARLGEINGIVVGSYHYHHNEEQKARFLLSFVVEFPRERYSYRQGVDFTLWLDDLDRLTVKHDDTVALVSHLDELAGLIACCRARFERQLAQSSKREKIRNLRAQAIVARLKQMAREEKFDFCTETNQRALKLYVKLSDLQCCELDVPFKGFEAMLPHLREAIVSLCDLHRRGLRFSVRTLDGYRWSRRDWVRHDR